MRRSLSALRSYLVFIQHQVSSAGVKNQGAVKAQRLLTFFMEDTIQDMAGFIPLTSLGQRLLSDLSEEHFGNFKSSLVGLLGAYNYELSILQV